jgi:lipopolysaccharide export system protein LptA
MTRVGKDTRFTPWAMAMAAAGAGVLLSAVLATSALGQAAGAGGPFGSGNAPIDISADELEVLDAESRAVWRGNVEAVQGANRMRAPVLNIYYARSSSVGGQALPGPGGGQISRMEAEGPVYYVTPDQNARADRAVYEAGTNTVIMTGNVVLVQGRNVVQGDRLTIDTRTNKATLVSNTTGRAQSGRVRGVFYPGQGQPGAAARP